MAKSSKSVQKPPKPSSTAVADLQRALEGIGKLPPQEQRRAAALIFVTDNPLVPSSFLGIAAIGGIAAFVNVTRRKSSGRNTNAGGSA